MTRAVPVLRLAFFLFVRLVVLFLLGLNIRDRQRLPKHGSAMIVANHNSHLDTMVLMSLFPLKQLPHIRAAAAADYFLKNKYLGWFALNIIGILPVSRKGENRRDPLGNISQSLENGDIVIFFPEGTRGEPEKMSDFKSGIAHLVKRHPDVPLIPVYLRGLGKALPRGEWIFVPFFCDVVIGEEVTGNKDNKNDYMQALQDRFLTMKAELGDRPN